MSIPCCLHEGEKLTERGPFSLQRIRQSVLLLSAHRPHRGRFAVDLGREALERERRTASFVEEASVFRMAVHVDEARSHVESRGVDLRRALTGETSDGGDAIARERHVALERRAPGTVEDRAVAENDVVVRGAGGGEDQKEEKALSHGAGVSLSAVGRVKRDSRDVAAAASPRST